MAQPKSKLPDGVAEVPPEARMRDLTDPTKFGQWLATQNKATRDYWMAQYNQDLRAKGSPVTSTTQIHKLISAANDAIVQGQQTQMAQGKTPPDVNPDTGEGMPFTSDKARADFLSNASIHTALKGQAQANALTPDQVTVNPTQIPLDEQAAHLENYIATEGQAPQEQALAQTRTDQTGADAIRQSLSDETAAINQGGLTAIDRSRIEDARMKRGMEARAQEQAIQQHAEQQGRAGSAQSLLLRSQAQQGAENARSQDDLQTMALGLQRKDTLMNQRASQGQSFQTINDAIDHFNTESANKALQDTYSEQNKRTAADTEAHNAALGASAGYRTGLNAQNAGITNQAEIINKSPTGGARGQLGASLQAAGPVIQSQQYGAGLAHQDQTDKNAQDAQSKALGYQLGGEILGAIPGFVNPFVPKPSPAT